MKRLMILPALLLSVSAFAADLPQQPAPYKPAPPRAADLFTGWWIGLEAGYGEATVNPDIGGVANLKPAGLVIGGALTYRSQIMPRTYLALETSLDSASLKDTVTPFPGLNVTAKQSWLGATTIGLGYTVLPELLITVKAGLAYGDLKGTVAGGGGSISDTGRGVGWTAGLAADYSLNGYGLPGYTVGAEYRYADLGTVAFCANFGGGFCLGTHSKLTEQAILATFKGRFGSN